jgi:3-dehydroquinate dehydratase / shikimate dehydrogenase
MTDLTTPRICISVCAIKVCDLRRAAAAASHDADIIELRLDCLEPLELSRAAEELEGIVGSCRLPVILTLRPAGQGGTRALDYLTRHRFWVKRLLQTDGRFHLADLELDYALLLSLWDSEGHIKLNWDRVICSYHDFNGVPADLKRVYECMTKTKARVLKIAVRAHTIVDCLPVFSILERARREGREMIAVAMGEAGAITRILAPSRGAFLTYGSSDEDHRTAPGQLPAAELRDLYRVHEINEETEILGVVGHPLAHSVSSHIHNAAFKACGINAVYLPLEVTDIGEFIERMVHTSTREIDWRLRGFSVTAHFKSKVMTEIHWAEERAREIGAVNTVIVERDLLLGFNTDAMAAIRPLEELINLQNARVAVIGASGSARAVLWALRRAGASTTVFARNAESAADVADRFGANLSRLAGASFGDFDIVINATPLGTRGAFEAVTPARAPQLRGASIVYDLVYNPTETVFLREARAAGCVTVGGLAMLISQAAEQFRLWTGRDAPLEEMRRAAATFLEGGDPHEQDDAKAHRHYRLHGRGENDCGRSSSAAARLPHD